MMVLMITLFFSGAHGCSSLPLACASQPLPPPPVSCPPPPPVACPPPPSVFVAPPPPPFVFAAPPPPPPSVFATPSPPPPPTNEGFWDVIRGWSRPMTIIVSVVTLLVGLGCCGRRYRRGRGHLQDVEDVTSAISDL
ncbi:hypothetical protein MtrunA17_Chr5g0423951 [Medicago truncatula]|nr:hypothetical protein MtrunA17_Chr5g0423951 [Medicago truncatula]